MMAEEKRFKYEDDEFAIRRVSDCEIRVIGEKGGQASITAEPARQPGGIMYNVTTIDPVDGAGGYGCVTFDDALTRAAICVRRDERKRAIAPATPQEACASLREAFDKLPDS